MIRFIKLTTLYVVLLFLSIYLILSISSGIVQSRGFENHETESNLLVMNDYEKFDLLFMGISHARNFSRHKNHLRLENILEKKIINIGQGGGVCGVNEQLFYLDYFYYKKNKASTLVYIISPPLFFSETLPLASNTFRYEPFELSFLFRYLFFESENKSERITTYLQTKVKKPWYNHHPKSLETKEEKLERIDTSIINEGLKMVYDDEMALTRFNQSAEKIKETIHLALTNNTDVVLIIPPALFGKWKGHDDVEKFAKEMQKLDNVDFYDFSESILSAKYYYDHHHLNTNGITYFTENYLIPIFNKK